MKEQIRDGCSIVVPVRRFFGKTVMKRGFRWNDRDPLPRILGKCCGGSGREILTLSKTWER